MPDERSARAAEPRPRPARARLEPWLAAYIAGSAVLLVAMLAIRVWFWPG